MFKEEHFYAIIERLLCHKVFGSKTSAEGISLTATESSEEEEEEEEGGKT